MAGGQEMEAKEIKEGDNSSVVEEEQSDVRTDWEESDVVAKKRPLEEEDVKMDEGQPEKSGNPGSRDLKKANAMGEKEYKSKKANEIDELKSDENEENDAKDLLNVKKYSEDIKNDIGNAQGKKANGEDKNRNCSPMTDIEAEKNNDAEKMEVDGDTLDNDKAKEIESTIRNSSDQPVDLGVKREDRNIKSDEGSVHSEDSEKENMNLDVPMDLSTKSSKSSTPAQDIVMLSDESDIDEFGLRRNGQKKIHMDEIKIRQKMIKRLQAELRNEEAKLVLLKKLRVSQMSHHMQNNIPGKPQQSNQHQSQPPPLVRGGNQVPQQPTKPAHGQPPQLSRPGSQPSQNGSKSQGPPPLVMAPRVDQRQMLQNQMKLLQQQQQQQQMPNNRSSSNNVTNYRGSQSQNEALRQMQQAQNRAPEETPAQRQAAAKLALRKQLEKTLLQIPPPKPPPPEMNFIPNLTSPDFVYLLGLEEAVNFIIDVNLISKGRKNPDEKMVCNPFTCVQCGTDFTPVWKREKPGSKNVICEQCVTTNQKKALKQEHTNRLKSAFVKALQQEQEIERMQSQESKSSSSSSSSLKEKSESRDRESPRDSPVTASRNATQAYKESMAETIRQHQNLLQAHQAAALRMGQPLGMQGFNPRAPFPYQLPFAARASDLQRQYLLDMIPKGGLPWTS